MSKLTKDGNTLYDGGNQAILRLFQQLHQREEGWSNIADVTTVSEELVIAASTRLRQRVLTAMTGDSGGRATELGR